jgi:hypothetical protein
MEEVKGILGRCVRYFFLFANKGLILKIQTIWLAASAAGLLAISGFAQVRLQPGALVGLGIFSETKFNPSDSFTTDNRSGFLAGAVLDIVFNRYVSLRPGIEYAERGGSSTITDEFTGNKLTSIDRLGYLAIPIDLKVRYPVSPLCSPYLLCGLNPGILLSAKNAIAESGVSSAADIKDGLCPVDFGFDLGIGFDFFVKAVVPFFEISIFKGVVNVDANQPQGYSQHNQGFEIKSGIKYKF